MSETKKMTNACYKCKYRGDVPGSAHSNCSNQYAEVTANSHGIKSGWFFHPWNFDPVWLESCTEFNAKEEAA